MQSLRATFKTLQKQAYDKKPIFPTTIKTSKAIKQTDQEINRMQMTNDFANYDETLFYKEKFEALHEITQKYEKKKMGRDLYQDQIKALLAKDYAGVSIVESKIVNTRNSNEPVIVPASLGYRSKTKSPLKEFFDDQQVKNSTNRVMFSNILSRQQTPLKYGLKSVYRSRSPTINNNMSDSELRRLKQENERLRNQLDADRSVYSGDDRLRELQSQITDLSQENRRLKVQVSSRSGPRSDYVAEEQYDPYNIKVRENNIMRINSRNLSQSEKMSQYGEEYLKPVAGSHIYYDNQSEIARSDFTHNPLRYSPKQIHPPNQIDLLNSSHSTIQTQFLNLDQSELNDEDKNRVCREKIAFFKKSMVLSKGQDFDIAFKRSDLNAELDRLRIILYVNNKMPSKVDCKIEYDFEREDFDLVVKRKLEMVEGRGQGRQEIEIYLKNSTDLGSLITAKVLVGSIMKKLVIPALFIDFDPTYKHQFQNIGYIERNLSPPLTIKPMHQFSSLQNASNILELTQQYDNDRYPVAKLYGRSKVTKGIVRMKWKNDKLRIETCEEWRTLMGYLFLNAEQTTQY